MYIIRDKETGNEIETVNHYHEALEIIKTYEDEDKAEGNYTPDFYEIVEVEDDIKYAIQVDYLMWNEETQTDYTEWLYLGLMGEHRIFVFDDNVEERTKLFDTATEAGAYVDKHFGRDAMRCSYNNVRIVEVEV